MAMPPPGMDTVLARNANPAHAYRQWLKDANEHLKQQFLDGVPAAQLVHARAAIIDALLCTLWRHFFPGGDGAIALVAAGGYGRHELHPGSDIDLQLLLRADEHTLHQESIARFTTLLWDIGLEVGHSVRSVEECANEAARDITIATNLMEARLLAGAPDLFAAMREAVGPQRVWPSREFFKAKLLEQINRHHKFNDTAYNLEPNIKEGPGGLRDIQVIGWVAKRHFGATTLHDLVDHGFLTEAEYQALIEGQNFLWRIRFALHTLTGRREDRLLFDYQRTLAEQSGYRDGGANLAVEQFMKRYYRTVMELSRLNEMLLQLFEEAILHADDPGDPAPLNKRFQARKGFVEAVHENIFEHYPFALLEIFLILQQHPELKGVRAQTIRLIRMHRHLIDDAFRDDWRNRALFMEILRQPAGLTTQLRRMNRYGVLAEYLPAFGTIAGLMQYDLFHVYTVDEHTLRVIRNLRRFALPQHAQEFPLCSEIMQQHIPKQEILYLAALFHDIAKGRGGDHSEIGSDESLRFCLHHGISQYDARLVAWLVRNHLLMSMTSQRKDIGDPDIIMEFAEAVKNPSHLNHLYLLTVADIRATNTTLWNSWKAKLLLELYTATMRVLRRGLENPIDMAERLADRQTNAHQILIRHGLSEAEINAVWRDFPEEYFLRYSSDEIAWHTEAIARRDPAAHPLLLIRHPPHRGGTEIFIHTPIDDRLFARATQALDQMGLNILDARIIGARNGLTLDTYIVMEASGAPIDNEHRIHDIRNAMQRALSHLDGGPAAISRKRPRQFRHFPIATEVTFNADERNQRTIMELTTADRPGLLSRVGQAMSECGVRLQNAKIATFGARVEDVFYITDTENRPLTDAGQFECLRATIVKHLDNPSI